MNYKKILIGFIRLILTATVVQHLLSKNRQNIQKQKFYESIAAEVTDTISNFNGEVGIYIKDLKTNVTYEYNDTLAFQSASLVKIPIMACVFKAVEEGKISLNDRITLKRKHKVGGCGNLKRYRSGSHFTIERVLELMITESDNTATNILTDLLGFDYINSSLNEFGLLVTRMNRNIMDLKLRKKGIDNYTTAREIGEFLEKIYKKTIISENASASMINILSNQKHNDRIPRYLPKELNVAHKTGYLSGICHDVGVVFTGKGDFIVCVLTSDFKSTRLAKNLIGEIAYKTYKCY